MAFDIKPEQFLTSGDVFLNLLKEALTGARTGLARGQELELQKLKDLTTASKALMSARMSKADPYIVEDGRERPATDRELMAMLLTGIAPKNLKWKPRPKKPEALSNFEDQMKARFKKFVSAGKVNVPSKYDPTTGFLDLSGGKELKLEPKSGVEGNINKWREIGFDPTDPKYGLG
ncbi:MAG: hypothetical protein J7L34_09325, partial [Thermotogaceae bacterium]|nr:hypothetical protein [Thermotogaceae bacterium]